MKHLLTLSYLTVISVLLSACITVSDAVVEDSKLMELNSKYDFEEGSQWKHYVNEDYGFEFYYPAEADYLWDDIENFSETELVEKDGTLYITTKDVGLEPFVNGYAPQAVHFTTYISDDQLGEFVAEKWGENCWFYGFKDEENSPIYDNADESIDTFCRRDKNRYFFDRDSGTFVFFGLGQEKMFYLKGASERSSYNGLLTPFDFSYINR